MSKEIAILENITLIFVETQHIVDDSEHPPTRKRAALYNMVYIIEIHLKMKTNTKITFVH